MLAELKQTFLEAYDENSDGKIDIREVSQIGESLSSRLYLTIPLFRCLYLGSLYYWQNLRLPLGGARNFLSFWCAFEAGQLEATSNHASTASKTITTQTRHRVVI